MTIRLAGWVLATAILVGCDGGTGPAPNAARLAFMSSPALVEGQETMAAVTVEVLDQFGNRYTEAPVEVSIELDSDPTEGLAMLSGTRIIRSAQGLAIFDDLSIDVPANGFTLKAAAGGRVAPTSSSPFDVRLTFATIDARGSHTCGVTASGRGYCWGLGLGGRLGYANLGRLSSISRPVPVSGNHHFTSISVGLHTCGVTTDGNAYCWGRSISGALGAGATTESAVPLLVEGGHSFAVVSAGATHTCGLTTDGEAYCWGDNSYGTLGDGTQTDRSTPTLVGGGHTFMDLTAAAHHTCAITIDHTAFCWGWTLFGRLGDGTGGESTWVRTLPNPVVGGKAFGEISGNPGGAHTCAVSTDTDTYCWGHNRLGQLGSGTSVDSSSTPVRTVGGHTFVTVSSGALSSCAVTHQGDAYCWGSIPSTNGTISVSSPVRFAGELSLISISAGESHMCGLTEQGDAYCWGDNQYGKLGNGTTNDSPTPVPVAH